jgi:hypothetical protein
MRSEPEGSSGSVSTAIPPAARTASTISGVAGGDGHRTDPRRQGLVQNPDDHRNAADVGQRLARQTGRRHARGDQDDRVHDGGSGPQIFADRLREGR